MRSPSTWPRTCRWDDGREAYLVRIAGCAVLAIYAPGDAVIVTVKTGHHHTLSHAGVKLRCDMRERRRRCVSRALMRAWADEEARG